MIEVRKLKAQIKCDCGKLSTDWSASIRCDDVGFVSLMKINDFATEQFVDFEKIDLVSL